MRGTRRQYQFCREQLSDFVLHSLRHAYETRLGNRVRRARVAKLADAKDLKSFSPQGECGFKSRPGHQAVLLPMTDSPNSAYDETAGMYHALWADWYLPAAVPALEKLFFSKVPAGPRVLDVCCGPGH